MIGRSRERRHPEDAAVASVEEILTAAAARHPTTAAALGRPQTARALWICACVSMSDAPTWLIYEDASGGIAWHRVPEAHEWSDVVDAALYAGGHADPAEVLHWLNGKRSDPWGADGGGHDDNDVIEALATKLAVR